MPTGWLLSLSMEPDQPEATEKATWRSWLLLIGVFAAAIAVTLVVGSNIGSSSDTTFPDLGDLANADPNAPSAEDLAPTFTLQTLAGEPFDLAQHVATDGRPVVLNLWASWCGPCRAEMPEIDAASSRHPEVLFIGVAVQDGVEDATAFATEIGISYTIAVDDGTVEEAYPILGLPATFFINADGTIAKRHVGIVTVDSLDDDIAELFGT